MSGSVVTRYSGGNTDVFIRAARKLGSLKFDRNMRQAMQAAGIKTRTQVRKGLKRQMGTKKMTPVFKGTEKYEVSSTSFTIVGFGKGLPITEFPVKGGKTRAGMYRWSPRQHWRLQVQPRAKGGRFRKIRDTGKAGQVSASPWSRARTFKRSYAGDDGIHRAVISAGGQGKRARTRRLFGAGVGKELILGYSAAAFEASAGPEMERQVARRFKAFMP
jgi:hypothetical protein